MKRLSILILMFFASCSSDNSSSSTEGTIFRSYRYNSATATEHFFENNGTRYEKIEANGKLQTKYFYDSNNKMIKIESYNSDGVTIDDSKSLFYDINGNINKLIISITGGSSTTWLYNRSANIVTGELDTNPANTTDFNSKRVRYTFNTDGLITKFENFIKDQATGNEQFSDYATFTYDSNKNVTQLKRSVGGVHDIPGGQIPTNTYVYTHTYDNKSNPLHLAFMAHYENYILLQNSSSDFNFPFGSVYRTYGKNNILNTTYPSNYIFAQYRYEYEYQTNGLPKKFSVILTNNNSVSSSANYNYLP